VLPARAASKDELRRSDLSWNGNLNVPHSERGEALKETAVSADEEHVGYMPELF